MEKIINNENSSVKSDGVRDLTIGSPYSVILSFALPFLISQLFQQLYNIADSLIVGHYLGTNALAAVSTSGTLIFMLVSFFEGAAMGAGVVIARHFGAKDFTRVSKAIHTSLCIAAMVSVILTVVGVGLTPTFLKWMNTDIEVMPDAIAYFRFYFAGATSLVFYNICRAIMVAVGDSKLPLVYLIISSIINVVLDILFVGIIGWGVWAAAFATVISETISAVLCLVHLVKPNHIYTVTFNKLRINAEMLKETLKYGMPSGVQNSVIAFANVIVLSQINSFGKYASAAFGSHAKIEGFVFIPIMAFNMAITTFISQNLGAKKYDRAKSGARFSLIVTPILAEIFGVTYYCFSSQLFGLFDKTPEVISVGITLTHIIPIFYGLLAFSHSVAAICRGAGKAFVPMFVMLGVWCVIRVTYIFIVMHFFGTITYVFWAYPLTWTISSIIYLIYYKFSDWVHGFEKKISS